jgi:hypothetical protein
VSGVSMQGTGAKCIWWIMRKKMRKHQSAGTSTVPQRIFIEGMTTNQCGTQVSWELSKGCGKNYVPQMLESNKTSSSHLTLQ